MLGRPTHTGSGGERRWRRCGASVATSAWSCYGKTSPSALRRVAALLSGSKLTQQVVYEAKQIQVKREAAEAEARLAQLPPVDPYINPRGWFALLG